MSRHFRVGGIVGGLCGSDFGGWRERGGALDSGDFFIEWHLRVEKYRAGSLVGEEHPPKTALPSKVATRAKGEEDLEMCGMRSWFVERRFFLGLLAKPGFLTADAPLKSRAVRACFAETWRVAGVAVDG